MKIPIFNTINFNKNLIIKTDNLNLNKLNNLQLKEIDYRFFPLVKILKNLPKEISLYETVIVTLNDYLVELFLRQKIKYNQLQKLLIKFANNKVFIKYKKIQPKKIEDIIFVKNNISSTINKHFKIKND